MRIATSSLSSLLGGVFLLLVGVAPAQGPGPQVPPARPAGSPVAEKADPQTQDGKQKPATPVQQVPGKPADAKPATPGKPATPPAEVGKEGEQNEDEEIPTPTQLPKGNDPADIAAMQSAQAMLRAEARLKRLLKAGAIPGIEKILTFEEISSWPYQDGLKGIPPEVKAMDGKSVLMTGFMLPIDEVENMKEFLLVQSLWSCCYGQPPDINGIVRVVMKGNKRIDYKYDPIKVTGQFKVVASYEDGYCIDIYQLHADEVDVIK
ncbi:MAG TPA: DUF3299 domain-containing protein [Planctomycetota bacterium]|nr:DUF3299 domain-containing protein [Planctomycetota bacterium]